MRIGLNLLHLMPEIGGGWNYIRDIVTSLISIDTKNVYIAFVTDNGDILNNINSNNLTVVRINIDNKNRITRLLYENTLLQVQAFRYRVDVMHWFGNYHSIINLKPAIVTIHDLQPFKKFNKFSFIKRQFLRIMVKHSIKNTKMLLPVSNATATDLRNTLGASPRKMIVIPAILNTAFSPSTDDNVLSFKAKYKLPNTFWLYVAHYYPHKNHIALFYAYHKLIEEGDVLPWPLVLRGDGVSTSDKIRCAIDKLKLNEHITFLPRLDEDELSLLYAAAAGMVFPSLYEGGGIPVLEAMACGCPVLASNIPSIVGFGGSSISYLNPNDVDQIAEAMKQFQTDELLRKKLKLLGMAQSRNYLPDVIIARLLFAYETVAKKLSIGG